MSNLPGFSLYARQPDDTVTFYNVTSNQVNTDTKIVAQSVLISVKRQVIVALTANAIQIYNVQANTQVGEIPEPGVLFAALSPAEGYLVTCTRPSKEGDAQSSKNLKVWDLSTYELVSSLTQRTVSRDTWPVLQWNADDSAFYTLVTNTVHVYSRSDGFQVYRKVPLKGVDAITASPGPRPLLASFCPEVKGAPATAVLLDPVPQEGAVVVRKSFFRTHGVRFLWNKTGTVVLALAYADFDVTNQSYYGEQKLHYLPADVVHADLACQVPLPKEGPVHDVAWSPTGTLFAVIAGYMPARVTLFDDKCRTVHDLVCGPYNIVRWNPWGRFLAVVGFGNLPGDVLVYEKKLTNKEWSMVAKLRNPAVSAEWTPDGRNLVLATTAPRLRVDNAFKIINYCGEEVAQAKFDILFEASCVPVADGTYPDRPSSPVRVNTAAAARTAAAAAVAAGGRSPSGLSASAPAYVPPGQRAGAPGAPPPAAAKAQASAGFELSKAASKNAKKRANRKNKTAAEDGEEEGGDQEQEQQSSTNGAGDVHAAAAPALESAAAAAPAKEAVALAAEAVEGLALTSDTRAKRVKALQKKLRQIQVLKEKRDKEGEASLEQEAKQKIESEAAILTEIAELEAGVGA